MNKAYQWSNIIVARSGASTISELSVVQKPSILIPYPAATDNHQYYNAVNLKKESSFYVDVLDHELETDDLVKNIYYSYLQISYSLQFFFRFRLEAFHKSIVNNHQFQRLMALFPQCYVG